ncbi:MAG: protein kinase [Candidatus Eremiobacteraeota bacterium]|nr:protein kinase [Candidatus Eremiobacteraeota bacterium]MCW5867711.1 protein kinase [Candidatus Eremiobacteraeota bacterium]
MKVLQERYQVIRELGRGGDGAVYLCSDRRLVGSMWAIKELVAGGPERAAFEREASLLSQLEHPRIPVVVDFFIQDDNGYLVREYLDGPSMYDLVERKGPVSQAQALQWGIQLAEVLVYLHRRNPPLYHRDLKPQNVMVMPDGIRLIDFGLAREDRGQVHDEQAGSLSFAAPEQMGPGHRLGPAADIYSLGAILYYLLLGVPPGPIGGEHRILPQRPGLSSGTEQLVLQCLSGDPQRRPGDAEEVLHALQFQAAALPAPPPLAVPAPTPKTERVLEKPRATTRWGVAAALVPLAGLLAAAAGLVLSRPGPGTPTPAPFRAADEGVSWPKVQSYIEEKRWDQAEGALRVTLSADPGSGWARLTLAQLPLLREQTPQVPLLLPLGGQESEHVNWIVQGVALGQLEEKRFTFKLVDTHAVPPLEAWQKIGPASMVLGPFGSQDALMLAPLTGNVPLLPLGSTDPRVSQAAPNVFPLGFPHWDRMGALIGHAVKTHGPTGMVLFSTDVKAMSTSAQMAEESIRKATGREVVKLGFHPEDKPEEVAARVAALKPDWIYLSDNLHERAAVWIANLRKGGVKTPVLCVFHPASEDFLRELKEVPGAVWLVEPLWQSRNQLFVSNWQKTYQLPAPDWNSALGYDAARLASQHWRAEGPDEVLKDLKISPPYTGLLGQYDPAHKGFKPFPFHYRLVEVENGQRKLGAEL